MTGSDLEKKVADWTGEWTAEYGALCNDLAQMKLSKGETAEAQELFQQALAVTEAAQTHAESGSVSEDEWETSWENNLQQMQQRPQPVLLDKRQSKPKPNATAQRVQPSASSKQRQTQQSDDDPDEFTIPYDGLHLLECHGMTQHDTVLNLEAFLQQMPTNSVAPVVRPVDDTHAVIVCANPADARSLLQICGQGDCPWQLQRFDQASAKSKALKAGDLQPPRVRQQTTTAVARRLIGNAIGLKGVHDKNAEQLLKAQRADKQAAQAEKQRHLDAAWGDD